MVTTKLRLSERTFRCGQCPLVFDRDRGAARNLAALVGEVIGGTSSPSCGATVNEPDGNPHQTHTVWAAGTATGRPTRSTLRRQATAARTERKHIPSQFIPELAMDLRSTRGRVKIAGCARDDAVRSVVPGKFWPRVGVPCSRGATVSEVTVSRYVALRRVELGLDSVEVSVPQTHAPGHFPTVKGDVVPLTCSLTPRACQRRGPSDRRVVRCRLAWDPLRTDVIDPRGRFHGDRCSRAKLAGER